MQSLKKDCQDKQEMRKWRLNKMVWYKGKEIGIDEIENLPEGNYVLVRKGCESVGGPIRVQ